MTPYKISKMNDDYKNNTDTSDHEFCVVFRHEALDKLKKMAKVLNIPEDKMGNVLVKGLHLIDISQGGKLYVERDKDCMEIDIKKL